VSGQRGLGLSDVLGVDPVENRPRASGRRSRLEPEHFEPAAGSGRGGASRGPSPRGPAACLESVGEALLARPQGSKGLLERRDVARDPATRWMRPHLFRTGVRTVWKTRVRPPTRCSSSNCSGVPSEITRSRCGTSCAALVPSRQLATVRPAKSGFRNPIPALSGGFTSGRTGRRPRRCRRRRSSRRDSGRGRRDSARPPRATGRRPRAWPPSGAPGRGLSRAPPGRERPP